MMHAQTDSPLAKLAAEIRLHIYHNYLAHELQSGDFMTYSTTYLTDLSTSRTYRASPPPSLARTAKFFYLDMEPLFRHVFAIHVMPARWGLRIGMGGYGTPSLAESNGLKWDPERPTDGGGLFLAQMEKCYVRVNDLGVESMDSLSDFFAQVVSNAERESSRKLLWDFWRYWSQRQRGVRRLPTGTGRMVRWAQPNLEMVQQQGQQQQQNGHAGGAATTWAMDLTLAFLRGMGTYPPNVGPTRWNGLGKAAEGIRELVFEYAPLKGVGCKKVVSEALDEFRIQRKRVIEERFWGLVVGLGSLQVVRIRGDGCPGWWKEYLEDKMAERVKAGNVRIVVNA